MIRDDLKKALVEALKAKDETKVATIRLINAAIKDKDIEARPKGNLDGIDDTAILNLLMSMVKQRNESISMYQKGGRDDLAQKEQAEIDVISLFLPKQMSNEEVKNYFTPPSEKKRIDKLKRAADQSAELKDLIARMQQTLGTKVQAIGNDKKGRIYIDYYTTDDLDRLCDLIEYLEKNKNKIK